MSSIKNNGGPAFPQMEPGSAYPNGTGMSLRDWFAGQAMTGLLAGAYSDTCRHNLREVPDEAYKVADAMLAAREAAQ